MSLSPRPLAAFAATVVIGVLLRLPWTEQSVATSALLAAATTVVAWYAGGARDWLAFVFALLVATSPWAISASHRSSADVATFLASSVAIGVVVWTCDPTRRLGRVRVVAWSAAAAIVAAAAWCIHSPDPPFVHAPPSERFGILLASDVGIGVVFFALVALLRGPRRLESGALLGGSIALFAIAPAGASVALVVAPLLFVASEEVARWCEALVSWRARVALLVMALGPTLPTLWSDLVQDRRQEVASLRRDFESVHRADQPLFCNDPSLATEQLGCSAKPLDEVLAPGALPRHDRDASVLLLLDRGRLLDGTPLPEGFESKLDLVARVGRKRLDLHRHEARLYRSRRQ